MHGFVVTYATPRNAAKIGSVARMSERSEFVRCPVLAAFRRGAEGRRIGAMALATLAKTKVARPWVREPTIRPRKGETKCSGMEVIIRKYAFPRRVYPLKGMNALWVRGNERKTRSLTLRPVKTGLRFEMTASQEHHT